MVQYLHGAGAKVVLREPGPLRGIARSLEADIFPGLPSVQPQTARLDACDGALRSDQMLLQLDGLLAAGVETVSGYQRLAAPEVDRRTSALRALAAAFVGALPGGPPETDPLPAIYTYFGQFIAHEVSRLHPLRKGEIVNLNTSGFDLDTLFYPDGAFKAALQHAAPLCQDFGAAALGNTAPGTAINLADLPRAPNGAPIVPDGRNDANPALAQLHVAILRKYRAMVEAQGEAKARAVLRTLLHAITIHDYLKAVVDDCVYEDVMGSGRKLVNPDEKTPEPFWIPIEFAAGAFRFGHAMVRSSYRWSRAGLSQEAGLPRLMRHTHVGCGLYLDGADQIRRMPTDWTLTPADMLCYPDAAAPNLASRIAPALAGGLQDLNGRFVSGSDDVSVNLAEKTLLRGQEVQLACAQSLWALIQPKCGPFLSHDEITGPPGSRFHAALTQREGDMPSLAERTPLWFYVLREAEVLHGGRKLGPLGGRIVMESLHAAIAAAGNDPASLPQATLTDLFDPTPIWPGKE